MLQDLRIQNYALIQQLQLQPSARLNIITGETGAGKSIMLGALGLLLGNRADTRMLFDSSQKCVIEGAFDIAAYKLEEFFSTSDLDYEQVCIMRREISPNGKSRAFINDTPVSLETMRSLGAYLMDVHSQHDTLQLGSPAFQLGLLDSFARNAAVKSQYNSNYKQYRQLEQQFKALTQRLAEANKELDYHTFLLNELTEASLQENEQEEAEEQLKRLEHAEEIKHKLSQAYQGLSESEQSILSSLKDVGHVLNSITGYAEVFQQLKARLDSCLIELDDLAEEISKAESDTEHNPELIEKLQDRLDVMYSLQRKHSVRTNAELLAIQEDLQQKVGSVLNLDKEITTTQKALAAAEAEVLKLGKLLSVSRTSVFNQFESELHRLLHELGMPNAKVVVGHKSIEPTSNGLDEVGILFSANKGSAPQPLAKVASGGEFSRLMLSIKYVLADKTALPTIIFDEIDTGISGEVAIKVGRMMQQMARNHQLIAISHLPQIAAQGDAHYFVFKEDLAERTISRIRKLSEDDRIAEIAHMIAGANPTATAIQSARELLALQ
jgi:DNA repair protein RecN (Recombination protein N)